MLSRRQIRSVTGRIMIMALSGIEPAAFMLVAMWLLLAPRGNNFSGINPVVL